MPVAADFTINTARRLIYHSAGTTVYTVNELYSYLMLYFDSSSTIDDTIPMTAQTPTAYTLTNGWFISQLYYPSFRYLKEGSITTIGWDALTYNYGIRVLNFNASGYIGPAPGDIGSVVAYAGGTPADTGRLLDFSNSLRRWWVRVDDTGDTFANTSTQVTAAGTNMGTLASASTTGENTWANPYTIGSLQSNTQLYIYQNDVEITPWWSTGHIDVLVKVQTNSSLIDEGKVTFFARQYSKLYDHYLADLSDGARTPIPLATFADSNNESGYRQMVLTTASAAFTVGEVIQDNSDSTIQGIVTACTGTFPNITLQYYLYNTSQTDFSASTGDFTGQTSGATATAVNSTSVGPANIPNAVTFTFGNTSQDLNNTHGFRPYDVIIDVNYNTLTDLYEYLKYLTRYGSSTSLNGHTGEDYTAVGDIRLPYDGQTGDFTESLTVTGTTSGATGIIVSDHENGAAGALVLRDVSGTFQNNEALTDTSTGAANVDLTLALDEISPVKQSPFGTLAGSKFFGARGVWLDNVLTADANNYELIDSTGVRQEPPATIAITVSGLNTGDRVSVFRTTGDNEDIDREIYTSHAANNDTGDNTFEVQETIDSDTPLSGVLRVVDNSLNKETRYSYTSWSGSTFSGVSPTLVTDYDGSDTAYVPFLDTTASAASESVSVTYSEDRFVLTVVRVTGIQPFKVKGVITDTGLSVTAVRNPDSVYQ